MYEFTEDCLIHIDQIDDEHRRLFQMLNEAISLAAEAADVSSIAKNLLQRKTLKKILPVRLLRT